MAAATGMSIEAEPWDGSLPGAGFAWASERSASVECIICGRRWRGVPMPSLHYVGRPSRWQEKCLQAHTWGCACGLFFPTQQAMAVHGAKHAQHGNAGHGRMDRVG